MSPRTARAGSVLAVCTAWSLIVLAAPAPAASPGLLRAPGPVGTVDTVAGPGFCAGPAQPDPASTAVGAVAADPAGALWFETDAADDGLVIAVPDSSYIVVTRVAPPSEPELGAPVPGRTSTSASRLAADGRGGLFVARPEAVVHLAEGGLIPLTGSTAAPGAPGSVSSGDGGPIRSATFRRITAITADASGNVYVADEVDAQAATITVRFLNRTDRPVTFYPGTSGVVTVAAGTIDTIAGVRAGSSDVAPGRSRLEAVTPVLAVADGRLYLGSAVPGPRPRAEVRMLNLGGSELSAHGATVAAGVWGTVTTVQGSSAGATSGTVTALPGIAADESGNLFLAEQANHRISRLDAAGTLGIVAGTGTAGFDGNDRPAVQTRLDRPYAVALGAGGRLFISDAGNAQVRVVDRAGTIRTALGNGAGLRWTCDPLEGAAAASGRPRTGRPVSVTVDGSGNVYFTASVLGRVYALASSGTVRPVLGPGVAGGALLPTPLGPGVRMTSAPSGALYLRDQGRVDVLNPARTQLTVHGQVLAPGAVVTVAGKAPGSSDSAGGGDGGSALNVDLGPATAPVAVDDSGNLLLTDQDPADADRTRLRQVDPQGTITTLLEGPVTAADGSIDTSRCCGRVNGLAMDIAGNLYLSDTTFELEPGPLFNGRPTVSRVPLPRVWLFNRSTSAVVAHGVTVPPGSAVPIAGAARGTSTDADGAPALQTRLISAGALALDSAGNLYLASGGSTIRRIDPRGILTTAAGTGQPSFNGDELKGPLTALAQPTDLAVDACGNLLIADSGNDRIRRLNLVPTCAVGINQGIEPRASRGFLPLQAALAGLGILVGGGVLWRLQRIRLRRVAAGSG